jgi:HD superfamily phosphohydrolase
MVYVQVVRDPIWGNIHITEVERQIIQKAAFQRLKGMRQLGFGYLAFPGAMHSRFEHSLGVMHVADMLLQMVVKKEDNKHIEVKPFPRQILRLAALLQDIGHPPFSHAMKNLFIYYPDLVNKFYQDVTKDIHYKKDFETFFPKQEIDRTHIYKHEFFTEYIICTNQDIRQVLFNWLKDNMKEQPRGEIEHSVNRMIDNVISRLAVGKAVPEEAPVYMEDLIPLFQSLITGDIDANKIDYLMRDNYYCGSRYSQDLDHLQENLVFNQEIGQGVNNEDVLKIKRDALKFVHSLLLARFRLMTEVHQHKWDIFATSKMIELLHKRLSEGTLRENLFTIFTTWNDFKLLDYMEKPDHLEGSSEHKPSCSVDFQSILTTSYNLNELAILDFYQTHPNIRACIDILADPAGKPYIIKFQDILRQYSNDEGLVVHIKEAKLPEFTTKIVGGGDLLHDSILRGISEASVTTLQLIVYGQGPLVELDTLKKTRPDLLPCESCQEKEKCVGNLNDPQKLLSELVVYIYRKIVEECGNKKIIVIDFLMTIMDKVASLRKQNEKLDNLTRQDIYHIAKHIEQQLDSELHFQIFGTLDLTKKDITSSFYQLLLKYEQLGIIAYERNIRAIKNEDKTEKNEFRFDRRFCLSEDYGQKWLYKIKHNCLGKIMEYDKYQECWKQLEDVIARQEPFIIKILSRDEAANNPLGSQSDYRNFLSKLTSPR